jgi:16S rRNA G966 N2-methylase RsmD
MRARLAKLLWPLSRRGRILRRRLALALFGLGVTDVDTGGIVPLSRFGLDDPDRIAYSSSGPTTLWRGMRGLRVTPDDVFVDYGAGKGWVVLQAAARYPFGKVIGVEISEELASIARENIARAQHRLRGKAVDVVVADAETWTLPDETTFVYMYKPFTGRIFEAAFRQIEASLDRRPRKLTFVYANPYDEQTVLASGRFRRVRTSRGLHRDPRRRVHVYVSA